MVKPSKPSKRTNVLHGRRTKTKCEGLQADGGPRIEYDLLHFVFPPLISSGNDSCYQGQFLLKMIKHNNIGKNVGLRRTQWTGTGLSEERGRGPQAVHQQ